MKLCDSCRDRLAAEIREELRAAARRFLAGERGEALEKPVREGLAAWTGEVAAVAERVHAEEVRDLQAVMGSGPSGGGGEAA